MPTPGGVATAPVGPAAGAAVRRYLDYLAVEQADPEALARIGVGLKVGAQAANVEIPGGELAILPELIRGHPSPHGFDLCGTAFGTHLELADRDQSPLIGRLAWSLRLCE